MFKDLAQPRVPRPLSSPSLLASVLTADLGDHSWQEQQSQEQQPGAGPGAGGLGACFQAHFAEVPRGELSTRAIRAGALQTSGSETLQPRFIPTASPVRKPGVEGEELWCRSQKSWVLASQDWGREEEAGSRGKKKK